MNLAENRSTRSHAHGRRQASANACAALHHFRGLTSREDPDSMAEAI